ncbi:hypothetical protein ACE1N8_10790 [Streptomyces sp. DSM 116494]|uniref:hypothetical protein n=1 Tax=Streptomyces okerensis TaxID=3344655 RepID=UPI003890B64A
MNAMELELGLYDWATLPCRRCESAGHVPGDLLRMARAQTEEEAEPHGIEFHVIQDSWTTRTAVPVTRALMAGLADRGISPAARHQFLYLLSVFVVVVVVVDDDDDIAEACKDAVRTGIWALYEEVLSGRAKGTAGYAYWLLQDVETVPARLERLLLVARDELPQDLD